MLVVRGLVALVFLYHTTSIGADEVRRVSTGLIAAYDFSEGKGNRVFDRSGYGEPLDLEILESENVVWETDSLTVTGETRIQSANPAVKIIEAIRRTGEITIETWIKSASADQSGPARIVSLSKNGSERNFTLGQDGSGFDVRFRTLKTSDNGIPSVSCAATIVQSGLTHVVYTRSRSGSSRIYVNGVQVAEERIAGSTYNWHGQFKLALANEIKDSRPWLGTYHLVALYARDLTEEEIQNHFKSGHRARIEPAANLHVHSENERLFQVKIAPLLVNHCLECHDAATRKGKLDVSTRAFLVQGGSGGEVLTPGEAENSYLYQVVQNDEMPKDRPPLSNEEKQALKDWINGGAEWVGDRIDPAAYVHGGDRQNDHLRRLTVDEYIETVRSVADVDVEEEARRLLPKDLRADGFSNTAYNLNVDLKHVDAYSKLAEIIVSRMDVLAFAQRFYKKQLLTDKDMNALISNMGMWLLRGPLEDHEIVLYRGISTSVSSAGGGYEEAVAFTIEAMLQSPRFLYRIENQSSDGPAWPVNEYELASRISYLVWGAPPDHKLYQSAESGALFESEELERQLSRMLKNPRALSRAKQFVSQWLDLSRLDHLNPNKEKFPDWDPALTADMKAETLGFFEKVVWRENRPVSELLNAKSTRMTPRLAAHYRIQSNGKGSVSGGKGTNTDLNSPQERRGILTHGSILTVGGDEASMVARGLFVMHELLRGVVKDPPPCVDTTPIPTREGLTQRGIAEQRIANPSCGGCHSKFEPLAFGLERFNGLGTYNETDEHGNPLREDGEILFPGDSDPVSYKTTSELMDLLAKSDRVKETITWKLTQFALGRPLGYADVPNLDKIHSEAWARGGAYEDLIKAIALSELIQMAQTQQ